MRKLLLVIGLIAAFLCSSGQQYQSIIPTDSTSWDVCHQELFGILKQHLFTNKNPDSIYSKLYLFGISPDTSYVGKVREDLDLGLLWYTGIYNLQEKLIMDMTLNINDSFQISNEEWSIVDSVYYLNGRKVIRFELQTRWEEQVKFIEGVGPNISVLYTVDDFDGFYTSCKYDNGSLVYINNNSLFNGCDPNPIGVSENDAKNKVVIYPIPVTNYLNIDILDSNLDDVEVIIRNVSGRTLYYKTFHSDRFSIPMSPFPQGIYLINISNKKYYYTEKILFTN